MRQITLVLTLILGMIASSCYRGPENLPRLKTKFAKNIASLESQKETTNQSLEDGLQRLGTIQDALKSAANKDKEFKNLYAKWYRIDKDVNRLSNTYDDLRADSDSLFEAMRRQTNSLSDQKTKNQLLKAISKTQNGYTPTLTKTETAIGKLRKVHAQGLEVIKALEVAVALGEISTIKEGLADIEAQVPAIMAELTATIDESRKMYDQKIAAFE